MASVTELCQRAWDVLKTEADLDQSSQETSFKAHCSDNAYASDGLLTVERKEGTREQCFLTLEDGRPVPLPDNEAVACLQQLAVEKQWVALKAGKPVQEPPPAPPVKPVTPTEEPLPVPPVEVKPLPPAEQPAVAPEPAEPVPPVEPVQSAESVPPAEATPGTPVEAPLPPSNDPLIADYCKGFVQRNEAVARERQIDPAVLQSTCEEIAGIACSFAIREDQEAANTCLDINAQTRQAEDPHGTPVTKVGILDRAKQRSAAGSAQPTDGTKGAIESPVIVDEPPSDSASLSKRPPIYVHLGSGVTTKSGIAVDGHTPALPHTIDAYLRGAAGVLLGEDDVGHGFIYRTNVGLAGQYMNFSTETEGDYTADFSTWGVGVVVAAEFVWKSACGVNVVIAPEMALLFGAWATGGLVATDIPGKAYQTRDARFVADWQLIGLTVGAEFPALEEYLSAVPYIKASSRIHVLINGTAAGANAPEGRKGLVQPDLPIGDLLTIDIGARF